jgi:hypothetical protein
VKLKADTERWSWDGEPQPPAAAKVEVVASPRIAILPGNPFEISMGSQQPVQYFVRRDDGLFELQNLEEPTGLSLAGGIERLDSGRLLLKGLEITLRSIESREPIPGVALDVGRPTVKERRVQTSLSIQPGRYYGMQYITEGYGFLLIRLSAETRAQAR